MAIISHPLSALVLLALVTSACGGKGNDSQVSGGTGATGAFAGSVTIGTDPNGTGGTGTGTGTIIDPNSACAKGTASASLAGVNMFVMFDRSSSMNESATRNGPSRWQLTSAALSSFFASPSAAGLNLALRFFPHDVPAAGCTQQGCDANACAMPLVGLGSLTAAAAPTDTQEKALVDAVQASPPAVAGMGMGMGMSTGGTPIYAALDGALLWAHAQHQKSSTENNVVVLVTDGQPNGCDTNIGHIAKLASDALAADGTRTYAVGLTGSQQSDMDQIARAGGTTKGIFVADGANTTQDLLDALAAIRGAILSCDFPMPQPKPGVTVEPSLINVNLTPSSGVQSTLAQVSGEAACASNAGWYYDNPAAPTRIFLCKSTCDSVTADPKASLEILLGCPTNTDIPK